ncbi:MAG: acyltransferase [Mycobacterium sp.]
MADSLDETRHLRTDPATPSGDARIPLPTDEAPKRLKPALRLAGLEGPRGVGCLSVVLVHVAVYFTPNVLATTRLDFLGQALTFFFVLSGFLLYMPYVKRLQQGGEIPDTREYLRHRILRVFPAYLVIFLIANFAIRAVYVENPFAHSGDPGEGAGMITDPLKLLAQLTLTQSLFPWTLQTGISPSWSLTTEFGFYLTLPLLGIALFSCRARINRPLRAAMWPAIALLGLGVVTNTIVGWLQLSHYSDNPLRGYWGDNWVAVLSRSFLALSDTFAFGMIAAIIYVALVGGKWDRVSTGRLQLTTAAVMVAGLLVSFVLFATYPHYLSTVFALASGAFILLIVAPLARGERSGIANVTDWRPIRYIGKISLSAYLWHYPILILVERAGLSVPDNAFGIAVAFVIVSALTIAAASVTYRWVEVPAMRLR